MLVTRKGAARLQIDRAPPSDFALHRFQSATRAKRVIFHLAPGKISGFAVTSAWHKACDAALTAAVDLTRKGYMNEHGKLDFGMGSGKSKILGIKGQMDSPAQPHLVDYCRASRFFHLAHLEHCRHQVAASGLSLHDGPTLSARRAARTDRFADALSLHVCGYHVRRPQLDRFQRRGSVHSDARTCLLCHPA